ncbi:MAG: DUF4145 domain-containing protein [Terriglobia bacterium]|jgi:hypothetical protein
MAPIYREGNVTAVCPDCKAITSFDHKGQNAEHGTILVNRNHSFQGKGYNRYIYVLMKCGGCGRGGLAQIHDNGRQLEGTLGEFLPVGIEYIKIPNDVPLGIQNEFREGELCAAYSAYRSASAMMRSVLEKALKDSGYTSGKLYNKIEQAAQDGIITDARRQRAQDEIRTLGNDILHDEWKEVKIEDFELAHHYAQRILEDLYDDRPRIVAKLTSLKRLPPVASATATVTSAPTKP